MESKLILEELYASFKESDKPSTICFCECCMTDAQVEKLLKSNLSELDARDFEDYIDSLFLTVGDVKDFQFFLPRIFELLLQEKTLRVNAEIVFGKLELAEWKSWEPIKQSAIKKFLSDIWLNELNKDSPNTSDVLCAIGQCESDLEEYLNLLVPGNALRELIEENQASLSEGKLSNCFWERRLDQMEQVTKWLNSEKAQEMICKTYEQEFG